ncbi:MAG: hypothetical protein EPN92_07965 [Chitinophagaceae bacterium]|nr:MAG: hypothetical protein EPN92_07965 [Chitinophagaceae bacterium]
MRKTSLFSAVLFLFLLVPASITWAQTVSVSGNVYEKHTVKKSFKTPQGIITAILPADMAAGNPCNPEGAKTISWLYIEKPCRVEMKITRSENVSPDSEGFLDEISDFLGKVSEEGAKMGTRLAKEFFNNKKLCNLDRGSQR